MKTQLAPGEAILWQGQPKQGLRLAPQDAFAVPFAAFWLLMVLFILTMALSSDSGPVAPLTLIILPIFVLAGLYMLIGRFVFDRTARKRCHYYLTTQRALIESGVLRANLRSVSLAATPEIRFRGRRNGRGTVQFGSAGPFGSFPPSWPGASQFLPPAFDDIEDAEHVYGLVLAAQRDAQRPPS